jgi:hypothetical protein
MSSTSVGMGRRQLLQIAGASGAALALPKVTLAQATKEATVRSSSLSLYNLVRAMVGSTEGARLMRLQFDQEPLKTIEAFDLQKEDWPLFVEMRDDGAKIRERVSEHLEGLWGKSSPTVGGFQKDFEDFVNWWKANKECDGYHDPYDGCTADGGKCPTPVPQRQKDRPATARYQMPGPHVDDPVKPVGNGIYRVRGEGFLPDAEIEVHLDGKLKDSFKGKWSGTFRCSQIDFEPKGLKKGTYEVFVRNYVKRNVLVSEKSPFLVNAEKPATLEIP